MKTLFLLCLTLAAASCGRSDKEGAGKEGAAQEAPNQDVHEKGQEEPAEPLDSSYLPTPALATLGQMELDAQPPCSLSIDNLRPALKLLAEGRRDLDAATDKKVAVSILSKLASNLQEQNKAMEVRDESDELRRVSAELSATLGDLAESLQLASDALSKSDKSAAAATMRRIQNGVANTRLTIDTLIQLCAG